MITSHVSGAVTWIDLESPTKEELAWLGEQYMLHPVVLEDLATPTIRARADMYEEYLYAVFHFPTLSASEVMHTTMDDEIDFIIGDKLLITAHYKTIEPLYRVLKVFETQGILKRENHETHAGHLFLHVMQEMYLSLEAQLEHIGDHLKQIESGVFAEEEKKMVDEISKINRILINFRRSFESQDQLLTSFTSAAKQFWGESFSYHVAALLSSYHKVISVLTNYKEVLVDLRETNDSRLSTKMNSSIQSLSMMAFVTFPLAIIVALFNMPSAANPLHGHPYDFWILLCIMAAALLLMLAYFKHKKWI